MSSISDDRFRGSTTDPVASTRAFLAVTALGIVSRRKVTVQSKALQHIDEGIAHTAVLGYTPARLTTETEDG